MLTLWECVFPCNTTLNLVVHVLLGVIRINARPLLYLVKVHEFLATLLLESVLNQSTLPLQIDPGERVAAVAVKVPAIRMTTVGEEHGSSMIGFRDVGEEIEGCVVVDEESLGVSTLTSDVVGSLHRVSDEEDGPIEAHNIVVSFACVELDSKSSGVSCQIRELASQSDRRVAKKDGSFRAGALEEVCFREMRHSRVGRSGVVVQDCV